jgi:ABC-type branched-subunit amino acid transport system ATPase component
LLRFLVTDNTDFNTSSSSHFADLERVEIKPSPLVARSLTKSFGALEVVAGFDHELQHGVVTGLVGPNGAGKTTIFNLLSGALKPDQGSVMLADRDITGKSLHVVSRLGLGRSFQDVRVFPTLTCEQNCALYSQRVQEGSLLRTLFLPRNTWRRSEQALEVAREAVEYVGLAPMVDTPAGSLSYAEQKLLAIARLLAIGAHTLLLDEPASGLDRRGVETLLGVVRRLADEGKTILLIEHNLDVVQDICQKVLFLDRGKVLAEGTPSEVFAQSELAELYFGA